MRQIMTTERGTWFAPVCAGVLVLAGAFSLAPQPALAQFVCIGNANGAEVGEGVPGNTASGANATAGTSSVACGNNATATGGSTAVGVNATAESSSGVASTAVGINATATGGSASIGHAAGFGADANNEANVALGAFAGQFVTGDNNVAIGDSAGSGITANNTISIGTDSLASGDGAIAMGAEAQASNNGMAIGTNAFAAGPGDVAVGQGARVEADNGSSFGTGATVLAGHTNSTAVGAGATTTRANQVMLGTGSTTYTMAGIASAASKAAQNGQTFLVTSDAAGNLATTNFDAGQLQGNIDGLGRRDDELADGIAIALALAQPMFQPGQMFAMRVGWGNFEGANAVGLTAAGLVAKGNFGPTSSTVLDGGIGTGTNEGVVAGRAGLTFGW